MRKGTSREGTATNDRVATKLRRAMSRHKLNPKDISREQLGAVETSSVLAFTATPADKSGKPIEVPREELSPDDQERFRLLNGPYRPPRTRRGAFLTCEWRGTVKVGGYTDALIPWPYAFRTGSRSLILCGDLVRAVRLESEIAIAHHWNVSRTTIGKWRQALGVEMWNPGSRKLLWRAVDLARTPEAREKISKAATGRTLSDAHRKKLIRLNRRPKSAAFKKLASERMRRRMANGGLRFWTPDEEALLGTMPDRDLARKLNRPVKAVAARRFMRRAGRLPDADKYSWNRKMDALLDKVSPREAARLLKRPTRVIQARRWDLGLKPITHSQRPWNSQQDKIIRNNSMKDAARLLGCSISVIRKRRSKLRLTARG